MSTFQAYFKGSAIFSGICLLLSLGLGYYYGQGSWSAAFSTLFIVAVLGVLEVSLSFDNAVVNAKILTDMDPLWRHRFITWGIAIAVFGMRIVFPLAIVAITAEISPWQALVLAASQPDEYARVLTSAHVSIAAFGGTFLGMVGLKYFFDEEKDVHWVRIVEEPLTKLGKIEAAEIALVLLVLYGLFRFLPEGERIAFLVAGMLGICLFVAVEAIGTLMEASEEQMHAVAKTGLASFLYLEVLDASFSFDGVIGAFALTNNLFVIALGLGIGSMFVRSLTLMLVERGTLAEYRYLEHGAFWAILSLSVLMLLGSFIHIPEVVTGLIGAVLIGLSFMSSVSHNRREAASAAATPPE
jgi:hypothetical protein